MRVDEIFLQLKDYRNILLSNPAGFYSGRMNSVGTEFYRLLGLFTDYFLCSDNVHEIVLKFLAKSENIESLGPILDYIQPQEQCVQVRYRIAVALTAEIDRLVKKEKEYRQLGLNDLESLRSYQGLEKYLEDYYAKP